MENELRYGSGPIQSANPIHLLCKFEKHVTNTNLNLKSQNRYADKSSNIKKVILMFADWLLCGTQYMKKNFTTYTQS